MCSGWRGRYYGGTSLRKKKATIDYYRVLGVDRDAELQTIRSAYRRLVRRYHPDVSRNKNAGRRFLVIQEAYEVLSDPQKRRKYDSLISKSALASTRRGKWATSPAPSTVSPAKRSVLRQGFQVVVKALGIRIDAGLRFGGPSHGSFSRQRSSGPPRKQRR